MPTTNPQTDFSNDLDVIRPPMESGLAQVVRPLSAVPIYEMPPLNNWELVRRDNETRKNSPEDHPVPRQIAQPVNVDIDPTIDGDWEKLTDGKSILRMRISSRGAHSLSLGFKRYHMPEETMMYLYSPDYSVVLGPYDSGDNQEHGQLWLPRIPSDEIVIEIQTTDKLRADLDLRLSSVNHGYRNAVKREEESSDTVIYTEDSHDFDGNLLCDDFPSDCPGTLACNVDVACVHDDIYPGSDPDSLSNILPHTTDWHIPIKAVGQLDIYGGVCGCTGTLVNNTNNDGDLLFMTASHCFQQCVEKHMKVGGPTYEEDGVTVEEMLKTVKVYWNYVNDSCRDYKNSEKDDWDEENRPDPEGSQVTIGGAEKLKEWDYYKDAKDTMFLRLKGDVVGIDVAFAGWDRSGSLPASVVSVHHPMAQEKRISISLNPKLTDDDEDINAYVWSIGVAQHGSSGSTFFDPNGRMVCSGLSHGGVNSCKNAHYDGIKDCGRLSELWDGLAPYLDPSGTGATHIDGYAPCAEYLSGDIVSSGTQTVEACSIVAGPDYEVSSGARMTFLADWDIHLKPGFSASPTGTGFFKARIK
jgi:lysyl endopeptidase